MNNSARFVTEREQHIERFKYGVSHYKDYFRNILLNFRRVFNICCNRIRQIFFVVTWRQLFSDFFLWLVESFVEGVTANFVTHYFFGVTFSLPFIFAHGILIKQTISIVSRLRERKDGSNTTIHTEDKSE